MLRTLVLAFAFLAFPAAAQELKLHSAGPGGAFLPYAQGLARHLNAAGVGPAVAVETSGSIANLAAAESEPASLGLAFLGTAHEAVAGTAFAQGRKHTNVRALFAMYQTSIQIAALRASGIARFSDLDAKRFGVGPAGGPSEVYVRAIASELRVAPVLVTGTANELAEALIAGSIDALWQGAIVPIPALALVADRADAVVFGLTASEIAATTRLFPFLAPASVSANTYRGQTSPLTTVAAWNFVVAHKDLPDARVTAILRAVFGTKDPARDIHEFAADTLPANAITNRVVPFHPAALRYYREAGVALRE
ncbi:MAG: TAXI family TRAP transporter solute-binding subunit [Tagaea sp.]|nr:TAXI family TRAP transporter solute-binding subunit [Tagaea sp.]